MKTLGPISLPITKPITIYDEMDIIDILLDSKIPRMTEVIKKIDEATVPQVLAFKKENPNSFAGVVLTHPPPVLIKHKEQKYLAIVAPNTSRLLEHLYYRAYNSHDPFEVKVINELIVYVTSLQKQFQIMKENSQTNNTSSSC